MPLGAGIALLATACSSGDSGDDSTEPAARRRQDVTITWWHNSNTDPGKDYYEKVADDFEAANPGVTVEISAMQHEDMLTKLDAAFQSGDAPDIYMERGGGELADHVEAGLTKDISDAAEDTIAKIGGSVAGWQVDGKTYALPFSVGVVGFWYNKALFEQAGITDAADHVGRPVRGRRQAQGRGHRARSPSAPATSGPPRTTGTTSRCASARRRC